MAKPMASSRPRSEPTCNILVKPHPLKRPAKERGFTLLEIVVVVFIIGIILSFATLSIGDRGRLQTVQTEAQRLTTLLELASQESILQAKEFALQITQDGYLFLVFEDNEWHVIEGDPVLRERHLPVGMQLDIKLGGQAVILGDEEQGQRKKADRAPRIYLLSSGGMTPFEATLHEESSNNKYRVIGEENGKLDLLKLGNEARS